MLGTSLNCLGILLGGCWGAFRPGRFGPDRQRVLRLWLGGLTAVLGVRTMFGAWKGGPANLFHDVIVLLAGLTLGKLVGRIVGLQAISNWIGRQAREKMSRKEKGETLESGAGFLVCTGLFCAAPLAILGPLLEANDENIFPLVIKAVMDAAAAVSFAEIFGGSVALAAVPVAAFQGGVWLAARGVEPYLIAHDLADYVNAVGGFLLLAVSLMIFEVRRIALADYLPGLAIVPWLGALWK